MVSFLKKNPFEPGAQRKKAKVPCQESLKSCLSMFVLQQKHDPKPIGVRTSEPGFQQISTKVRSSWRCVTSSIPILAQDLSPFQINQLPNLSGEFGLVLIVGWCLAFTSLRCVRMKSHRIQPKKSHASCVVSLFGGKLLGQTPPDTGSASTSKRRPNLTYRPQAVVVKQRAAAVFNDLVHIHAYTN